MIENTLKLTENAIFIPKRTDGNYEKYLMIKKNIYGLAYDADKKHTIIFHTSDVETRIEKSSEEEFNKIAQWISGDKIEEWLVEKNS